MKLSELLKALIASPDNLENLPQMCTMAEKMESDEFGYQDRIGRLQEVNKSLLAQIPVTINSEDDPADEGDEPTLEDAKNYLVELLTGE